MSDIIQDAKRLLDGATPGPWTVEIESFTENEGGDFSLQAVILAEGEPLMGADDGMVYHKEGNFGLAASAPELAQALVEETWEYAVAFKSTNGMGYLDRFGKPQPWPCLTAWYLTKEIAQVALMNSEYRKEALCIVRRRVSPVEICE